MKKKIAILFFCLLISPAYSKIITLSNEYVKISVDDLSSRFYMETLKGNPRDEKDDNQVLLKKAEPPSSLTTLFVDGEPIIYGDSKGKYEMRPTLKDNKIVGIWSVKGLLIRQTVKIVKGQSTGLPDTMEILYKVKNNSGKKMKFGARILFDTYLGDHDGFAYRIPGVGDISKETQFYRNSIPDYWYCFDSYEEPKVKTQGILIGKGVTRPDKIVFANWDRLYDNLWDFVVDGSKKFNRKGTSYYDSAVALYYEPLELAAKENFYISALYGIYGENSFSAKDLYLNLSMPAEPNQLPIPVSVEFKNKAQTELDSLKLFLSYPSNFNLEKGETNVLEFVKVGTNETRKGLWHLLTKKREGTYKIKIKTVGKIKDNEQFFNVYHSFTLNIPNPQESLVTNSQEVKQLEKKLTEDVSEEKTNRSETLVSQSEALVSKKQPEKEEVTVLTNVVLVEKSAKKSPEVLRLEGEIKKLDDLIREVDQKYQILMGVYRNTYHTNLILNDVEFEIRHYENVLKNLESLEEKQKSEGAQ